MEELVDKDEKDEYDVSLSFIQMKACSLKSQSCCDTTTQ